MLKLARFQIRAFTTHRQQIKMAVQSPSVGRNKLFILEVVKKQVEQLRSDSHTKLLFLEIAAGTGEHAALFVSNLPNCTYLATEMDTSMHPSIEAWCAEHIEAGIMPAPISLNVLDCAKLNSIVPPAFCSAQVDVVININMVHISPWSCTDGLFRVAATALRPGGIVIMYGPFRVNGEMVESNVKFEQWLKNKSPEYGVRDVADVAAVAKQYGLIMNGDPVAMPANNLILIFKKSEDEVENNH